MKTEHVLNIVRAYAERKSPKNLMDLFPTPDKMLVVSRGDLLHILLNFAQPLKVNVFRLRSMKGLLPSRRIYIDSSRLDGFLEPFISGRCNQVDCDSCGYCEAVARRAIRFEDGYREQAVAAHRAMLGSIMDGSLFSYRWKRGKKT